MPKFKILKVNKVLCKSFHSVQYVMMLIFWIQKRGQSQIMLHFVYVICSFYLYRVRGHPWMISSQRGVKKWQFVVFSWHELDNRNLKVGFMSLMNIPQYIVLTLTLLYLRGNPKRLYNFFGFLSINYTYSYLINSISSKMMKI